jgi:hypothetical protein
VCVCARARRYAQIFKEMELPLDIEKAIEAPSFEDVLQVTLVCTLHSELYTLSYAAHLIAHQLSAAHCTLNFQSALRTRTGPAVYQLAAEQEPHERDEDRHHCGVFHGDGGAEHPLQRSPMLSSNTNPRSNLVSFRSCTLLCVGSALGLSRGVCSDYA